MAITVLIPIAITKNHSNPNVRAIQLDRVSLKDKQDISCLCALTVHRKLRWLNDADLLPLHPHQASLSTVAKKAKANPWLSSFGA